MRPERRHRNRQPPAAGPRGSTAGAPAASDQVASRADPGAEAPGSEPAAQPQQRQAATEPAPAGRRHPRPRPPRPRRAARDQAPPPTRQAATASREPAPVGPPARQPDRQVEARASPGEPQSPPAKAAPAPQPLFLPAAGRGWRHRIAGRGSDRSASAPSGATDLAKEDAEPAAPRRRRPATRLAQPRRSRRLPRLPKGFADRPGAGSIRRAATAPRPSPWPSRSQPSLQWRPDRPKPEAEPAPGPSSDVQAAPDEPALQQTVPAQEQEPRDEPRSAPARAAETIKRAITSLFGGATDAPVPPKRQDQRQNRRKRRSPPSRMPGRPRARAAAARRSDVDPGAAPTFDIVRIEPRGRAVMAGRAAPGAEVEIRSGDRLIDRARADQRGEWVVVPAEPLARGVQELRLSARLDDRPASRVRGGARGRNT